MIDELDIEAPEQDEERVPDDTLGAVVDRAAARHAAQPAERRIYGMPILAMGSSEGLNIKPDGFFAKRLAAARERNGERIAQLADDNREALDRLA